MKLDARTGTLSPEEVTEIVQEYLEKKLNCKVNTYPAVKVETKYDDRDWRGEYPPDEVAIFKGYSFVVVG